MLRFRVISLIGLTSLLWACPRDDAPSSAAEAGAESGLGGGSFSDVVSTGGNHEAEGDAAAPNTEAQDGRVYEELCEGVCLPGGDPADCAPAGSGSTDYEDQQLYCQFVVASRGATAHCGSSGSGESGSPCSTVGDCGPGLGCILEGSAQSGVCRAYCCGDVEACPASTYCTQAPMSENSSFRIPSCIAADGCTLLGDDCADGTACTIVRADGTTSCVTPGEGQWDEPCECAEGFVCSKLTNQCKKLCHLDGGDCGEGWKCQGGSGTYPTGFGICVGGDYD